MDSSGENSHHYNVESSNHSVSCIPTASDDSNLGQVYGQLNCYNQRLLINASVSIQRKVSPPCYRNRPWPCPFKNMSICYSDDTNLVGRAHDLGNQQFRMISILECMAEAEKIKFNKYKCRARQQSWKFTCTNAEWLQRE